MHKRLEAFLFRLARDHVPTGIIEEHVSVVEKAHSPTDDIAYQGEAAEHLGGWAEHVAKRLVLGGRSSDDPLIAEIRTIVNRAYAAEFEPEGVETEEDIHVRLDRNRQADYADDKRRISEIRALLRR